MKRLVHTMLPISIAAALLVSGCATVMRGSTEVWTVGSKPMGATVSLSNGGRCKTPCSFKLRRKYPVAVELCMAGYEAVNTVVTSEVSGAGGAGLAGNAVVGGLVGIGVDAATGASKDLRPNPLVVELVRGSPGCVDPAYPEVPVGGQGPEEQAAGKPME